MTEPMHPTTPPLDPTSPLASDDVAAVDRAVGMTQGEAPVRTRFAEPAQPPVVSRDQSLGLWAQEPVAPEPAAAEPVAAAPAAAEPTAAEPVAAEPTAAEPVAAEPLPPLAAEPAPAPELPAYQVEATAEPVPQGHRVLVPVLAGVAVVLAALAGFLGWRVNDTAGAGPVEASRADALQAARNAATLVFSYDYRHLDKDFEAGRAVTTGSFRKEYDTTTGKLVGDVATRYKGVVVAAVSEASVVQATEATVVTLVFVNQQSTSSLTSAPKVTQSRLEMTMVHRGGHWLVSDIKAL